MLEMFIQLGEVIQRSDPLKFLSRSGSYDATSQEWPDDPKSMLDLFDEFGKKMEENDPLTFLKQTIADKDMSPRPASPGC